MGGKKIHMLRSREADQLAMGKVRTKSALDTGYVLPSPFLFSSSFPSSFFPPFPFLFSPLLFLATLFFPLSTQLTQNYFIWRAHFLSLKPSLLHMLRLHPGRLSLLFVAWLDPVCLFRVFSGAAFSKQLPLIPWGWVNAHLPGPPMLTALSYGFPLCIVFPWPLCLSSTALRAPWRQKLSFVPLELYPLETSVNGMPWGYAVPLWPEAQLSTPWIDKWVDKCICCSLQDYTSIVCILPAPGLPTVVFLIMACIRFTCVWGSSPVIL